MKATGGRVEDNVVEGAPDENRPVTSARLQEYCAAILSAAGLPDTDAITVAMSLVDANLRGVHSHGVSRIPIYVDRLRRGLVNKDPQVKVVRETGGTLVVDGDNGMGQVVMQRSLELAQQRLPAHRTVSVAVRGSNHYGSGAYFARQAAAFDAAIFLYGNAPATMAAFGGRDRFLGTNPYTFAVPAGDREPMVLDMATSVVARGKIISAAQSGDTIPEGWAVDPNGMPTTDADAALAGSVLPFGGPKGYGIALVVEVMAAMFSGANSGPEIGDLYEDLDRPQGVGAFFTLYDIDAFVPVKQFAERMELLYSAIKDSGPADGEVLLPGELEERAARRHLQEGILLPPAVVAQLENLSPESTPLILSTDGPPRK
ncbi:LDH2 family malate/lactate/ureidoglycolate dehydrogenase [Nesterenkonia sandarakina]|uniref:LDH2 family malate/lactate/ureidoglycolate dehydrogenase n=1 Tax=Nesterenkonia sandarakina TaxID=272918 RepID=A0A2T0YAM1_9MICC|nr:LDH2 family malate/lactate/ureidoglycolate dehydrogenase [Nesterenkonia sandarakina]